LGKPKGTFPVGYHFCLFVVYMEAPLSSQRHEVTALHLVAISGFHFGFSKIEKFSKKIERKFE
jgi:hypothetical protein